MSNDPTPPDPTTFGDVPEDGCGCDPECGECDHGVYECMECAACAEVDDADSKLSDPEYEPFYGHAGED